MRKMTGWMVALLLVFIFIAGSYATKIYMKQGGDEQVVASGGKITLQSGSALDASGTATIAGISQGDLVDKSAAENITGRWKFADKDNIVSLLSTARGIYADTDTLVAGEKEIDYPNSKSGTVPRVILSSVNSANAVYLSEAAGSDTCLVKGTGTDSFDYLVIGEIE